MSWIGRQGVWLFVLLLVGLVPAAASAQAVPVDRACHTPATAAETWADVAADSARWRCDDGGWSLASDATFIRYDLMTDDGRVLPQSLSTHTGLFDRIDVGVIDRSGHARWSMWNPADLRHSAAGPYMSLQLPAVDSDSRQIVVRVLKPWGKTTLSEMRLIASPEGNTWPMARIVAMAAICGMLLVPLLINTAFYTVLPERYVIWHLVMVGAMLVQAAFATGFVHLVADPRPRFEWWASAIAFTIMASAGLMFAATFLEPGNLSPRLRRMAMQFAPVVLFVGIACCVPLDALRAWSSPVIHATIGVAIALIATMIIDARRRGSRAAKFLIVGWTPILVIGTYRILAYLIPGMHPTEAIVTYQLALAFEVLVTALGIVSRFVDLRQERDDATARAIELEGVADRDPLTGLRNRRSIEGRFEDLFQRGFRTMAVVDLDLFKSVNDTHGHSVGDTVLRAAAKALVDDRDTKAIRMGGEEFILLLRGPDSVARAENCRRAITTRVAAAVPGLDRLVTASMGLVEHDTGGTLQIEFAALYARCDRLLYEAKRLGRNRTMKERVTGFEVVGRAVA